METSEEGDTCYTCLQVFRNKVGGEQLLSSGEGQFGLENTFHTFLVIEFDCLAVLLIQNFHKRIYIFF